MIKALLVSFVMVTTVQAEEIRLRSGFLDFDSPMVPQGSVHLEGKEFVFDGFSSNGYLAAADCAFPCSSGETVSLDAFIGGGDLYGTAIFGGEIFGNLGGAENYDSMYIEIEGDMRAPGPRYESPVTKTATVKITGDFYHLDTATLLVLEEVLHGFGTATVTWNKWGDSWMIEAISYDISPKRSTR